MHCFTKNQRLLEKKQFDYVFSQAAKLVTNEFIILFRKSEEAHARLGLALSKKKVAKSNQRNRLKRLLRETFRLHSLPAVDIVVLARSDAASANNKVITTNLSRAWKKLATVYEK